MLLVHRLEEMHSLDAKCTKQQKSQHCSVQGRAYRAGWCSWALCWFL